MNLQILKKAGGVVERNRGATLVDIGDGIACLEFHTKMNTVDPDLTTMLNRACDIVETDFDSHTVQPLVAGKGPKTADIEMEMGAEPYSRLGRVRFPCRPDAPGQLST